jgi:purine-cytosine permease-like protein
MAAQVLSWVVTEFGLPLFDYVEQWAWIPTGAVLFILAGAAGPYFNLNNPTTGDYTTRMADRLSMFSLCLSATSGWAPAGADYYVYLHEKTPKRSLFFLTWAGEVIGNVWAILLGAGIASGISTRPAWAAADQISPGALLVSGFSDLGAFGKFCGVILTIGIAANNVPGTYSAGLSFQCLGSWPHKVPRMFWNSFAVVVYTICAAIGKDYLYDIFEVCSVPIMEMLRDPC